jgi:hypothetical protein
MNEFALPPNDDEKHQPVKVIIQTVGTVVELKQQQVIMSKEDLQRRQQMYYGDLSVPNQKRTHLDQ